MKKSSVGWRLPLLLGLLAALGMGSVNRNANAAPEPKKAYEKWVAPIKRDLVTRAGFQKTVQTLKQLSDPLNGGPLLSDMAIHDVAASPCAASLTYLADRYATDPRTREALQSVNRGLQNPPVGYNGNPWKGHADASGLVRQMMHSFGKWCEFLPEIIGSHDNGLYYIQYFSWFYYRNPAGIDFVQGRDPNNTGVALKTGLKFTRDFSNQRGRFMDSPASTGKVKEWVEDPRIEITDYYPAADGTYAFKSWNEFFARQIKIDKQTQTVPSRPATMPLSQYPERDYIVVSPTDCIMNPLVQVLRREGVQVRQYVDNPLQEDMVLDVKHIPIGLMELLGNAPETYKKKFVGGTGLSCVLMPNTYHHFHSPVNGVVKYADIVKTGTYGYEDFVNWVPLDGIVGRPGTDFSQFQQFQRGVVIIEVTYKDLNKKPLTGYVASIPVGLDTIGSVVLDKDIQPGKKLKRGYTRLGNFYYGGSLNILLFSKGLAKGVVQTRMGNQITLFNVGHEPKTP